MSGYKDNGTEKGALGRTLAISGGTEFCFTRSGNNFHDLETKMYDFGQIIQSSEILVSFSLKW